MAIENNQVVAMMYELKVDGEVVDSNIDKDPLEFTFGTGQIIPGLETRIIEMNEGDSKDVTVPAAEAYGEYNEEAKQVLPKEQFGDLELSVGMPLQGQGENGQPIQVVISDIKEDGSVEVDFNHPLAGKELNFSITINSII
ncbi:peptidylprolyl isomerase [Halarcobacter mediterraneus]|uniref:Peptidyl-prolyl cis-trans isomerase n=1 Tax=Halarcobacter mediterraneus TaxID=2023153 RepID=A0A4Q1AZY6_9BACT|nr:peptidylprolyl isomerase [Halarcobacter mediterraneus]RXK14590.1 peptidylprolyl isomerase [Halarcobacter mediterraneus]